MKMEEKIYPVQLVETILKGHAKPQRVLFSDGHTYAVKFKNNPSGTRVLVNEYIAGKLGQLLSLPVVPFKVVQISDDFLKGLPILSKHKFTSGSQFASLFIDNCIQLLRNSPNDNVKVSNQEQLAGMIVFDLWIGNTDRKENNVLLKPTKQGEYHLYMIDHGRCFSNAKWTVKTLRKMPKMEVDLNVHKWSANFLQSQNELNEAIAMIMAIPEETIYNIIKSIPLDWDVSDIEKEALVTHLIQARQQLPEIQLHSKQK